MPRIQIKSILIAQVLSPTTIINHDSCRNNKKVHRSDSEVTPKLSHSACMSWSLRLLPYGIFSLILRLQYLNPLSPQRNRTQVIQWRDNISHISSRKIIFQDNSRKNARIAPIRLFK
ncbi:hypothetical protein CBM2617_B120010 [Cupriavidus taiwanensis]|nr:hypothetical protein CBM2617_B120010 [Cupriavidus taiwanensis]SOZ84907.1 hypothetical protein CBM2618_B120010 [Cupriavidus taiwanensis]SOZ88134.1 hypothetical protein CBM2622_B130009 [Cupriavidus taiwanensis]